MRVASEVFVITCLSLFAFFPMFPMAGHSDRCNGDSPSCPCFVDGGAWNPVGSTIQEVALATLGTQESCMDDGGKPYYQMRLGISTRAGADLFACILEAFYDPFGREAWCSEAISYWHRKAGIPYSSGYRNSDWLLDWQLKNTDYIRTFYAVEDSWWGRGRWIDWSELNYDDLQPGINAPLPGAYVLIRYYNSCTEEFGDAATGHSMLVDEMTVYRAIPPGRITRVELTIVEGNSNNRVENTRVIHDALSVTPAGEDYIDSRERKILGFGIDLDVYRQPIYDVSKLHFVTISAETEPAFIGKQIAVKDPFWDKNYAPQIPKLKKYSKLVHDRGIKIICSQKGIDVSDIPDGNGKRWTFPPDPEKGKPETVEIEIDLLVVHPLPIKGIVLGWATDSIPSGYRVQWAGADHKYKDAKVPEFKELDVPDQLLEDDSLTLPVTVNFSESEKGLPVRYVRLIFPQGTFQKKTRLNELRFLYYWGPREDAPENP